jgi:hypothetical protein
MFLVANENKLHVPAPTHMDHHQNLSHYKLRILWTSSTHRYKSIL